VVRGALSGRPLARATNASAPIRHRLPDFFQGGWPQRMGCRRLLPNISPARQLSGLGGSRATGRRPPGWLWPSKLIESAQRRWRMVNAPHLVALVRAGAVFVNGKLIERPKDQAPSVSDPSPALASPRQPSPALASSRQDGCQSRLIGQPQLVISLAALVCVSGTRRSQAGQAAPDGCPAAGDRRSRRVHPGLAGV
jgi:hypothetical protein